MNKSRDEYSFWTREKLKTQQNKTKRKKSFSTMDLQHMMFASYIASG